MGLIACQGGKREGQSSALPPPSKSLCLCRGLLKQLPVTHFLPQLPPHRVWRVLFPAHTQEGQAACGTGWSSEAALSPQRCLHKAASSEKEHICTAASPQVVPLSSSGIFRESGNESYGQHVALYLGEHLTGPDPTFDSGFSTTGGKSSQRSGSKCRGSTPSLEQGGCAIVHI